MSDGLTKKNEVSYVHTNDAMHFFCGASRRLTNERTPPRSPSRGRNARGRIEWCGYWVTASMAWFTSVACSTGDSTECFANVAVW